MLNAEKHKKEILDITKAGYYFAISKDRQNIVRCTVDFACENCIFNGKDLRGCDWSRTKWLLSEYKEPIKLTRFEFEMLKWLDKEGYKFIVRSPMNNLTAHDRKPKKSFDCKSRWVPGNEYKSLASFNKLLLFVKWEDEKPTSIQDVLKNCEVKKDV